MNVLHSMEGLQGFSIVAKDGELGSIKDVYFDDHEWTVRYLVVDTGGWLTGRKVLISPASVTGSDWRNQSLAVNLTKEQVQNSPSIDTAKPVVRQHEVEFYDYYGYPYYWTGPYLWGYTVLPGMLDQTPLEDETRQENRVRMEQKRSATDPHLRSANEVIGYDIQAKDDTIGHVEDLLFNEESWKIELLVVDTRNWWPGKKVMVSPERIERVSWEAQLVEVRLTREEVEDSPEFVPERITPQDIRHSGLYRQFGSPPWRP